MTKLKKIAQEKVGSPFVKPYPFWHITTLDRLKNILVEGLVSENYAKKVGKKDFKRNFDSSWNADYISLMSSTSPRKTTAPDIAILISSEIEIKNPDKIEEGDTNRPVPGEVLVKDIIKPESFLGLVIGEVGYDFEKERYVKPKPVDLEKVVEVIESVDLEFSLPIYFKGRLVWPYQL